MRQQPIPRLCPRLRAVMLWQPATKQNSQTEQEPMFLPRIPTQPNTVIMILAVVPALHRLVPRRPAQHLLWFLAPRHTMKRELIAGAMSMAKVSIFLRKALHLLVRQTVMTCVQMPFLDLAQMAVNQWFR